MDLNTLKTIASDAVDKHKDELNELSQAIWSVPELNFNEHSAHRVLTKFLEKAGFKVERNFILETGFRATYGDNDSSKPNICVICEYDALPEIGHACGHNLIAEVGVATGLAIKAAMDASPVPLGKVTVLGTPAEEGGGGKIDLINAYVFDDIDIAMMSHPAPFDQSRPTLLSYVSCKVVYNGRASHAAGFPWEGVNALDAAVLCYQNVSCLRQHFKPLWRVHGVITKGGSKPNIIPDLTELEYYCRAPTDTELDVLKNKISKCFESAAVATGCTVDVRFGERGYSSLISNNIISEIFEQNAAEMGIVLSTKSEEPTGSTDMGNVTHVVPGIQPLFCIGGIAATHTKDFQVEAGSSVAQMFTLRQARVLAMTVLDIFAKPELLTKIKEEFINDTM
ncbi:xaa-Arg dipeptidase [Patella vulgata]|uniref:xaa-Arg dipeptidase n=1 Tax=Patella vulgata TaxID=6465 RepID=UPI0024A7EFD1|nr:xaa-Arg dipeptidase [Patella vulgata]